MKRSICDLASRVMEAAELAVVVIYWSVPILVASCGARPTAAVRESSRAHSSCDARLAQGQKLERQKAYAEALEMYLPCTDDLVPRIAMLSKVHRPAREALERRRIALQKDLDRAVGEGGNPGERDTRLLVEINAVLQEDDRSVALLDRASSIPSLEPTTTLLRTLLWAELVDRKRYKEALLAESSVRDEIYGWVAIAKDGQFGQGGSSAPPNLRAYIQSHGAKYAEALLASGRSRDAQNVFEAVLTVSSDAQAYVEFIQRAARCGDKDFPAWIYSRAAEMLPASQMLPVDSAFREITRN